jgi:hypothetical protein
MDGLIKTATSNKVTYCDVTINPPRMYYCDVILRTQNAQVFIEPIFCSLTPITLLQEVVF